MANTEQFDLIAKMYDTSARVNMSDIISQAIRKYLSFNTETLMDFGCGTGLIGLNFTNDFSSVLFLDSSQEMISEVERKITELKIDNAVTMCFDIERNQLTDIKVDCIIMSQVLLHIRDTKQILMDLVNLLNDGGQLIIVDYVKNEGVTSDLVHGGFEIKALNQILENIGYSDIKDEIFFTGTNNFLGKDASMFVLSAIKKI